MSEMDPELKRLLRWARQAPALPPAQYPWGFADRVVQRRASWVQDNLGMWQRVVLGSVWPAAAVLLLGLGILALQHYHSNSSYDLSPAYQVVSLDLIP